MTNDEEAKREAAAVWRCAVGDMVACVDAAFTHPLMNSRRKAERELGERMDLMMQALFKASRSLGPGQYSEAVTAGKSLIALAKDQPA